MLKKLLKNLKKNVMSQSQIIQILMREHGGIAYFPVLRDGGLYWKTNARYLSSVFCECGAREYPELGIEAGVPIYSQFCNDPDKFLFVSNPQIAQDVWKRA